MLTAEAQAHEELKLHLNTREHRQKVKPKEHSQHTKLILLDHWPEKKCKQNTFVYKLYNCYGKIYSNC